MAEIQSSDINAPIGRLTQALDSCSNQANVLLDQVQLGMARNSEELDRIAKQIEAVVETIRPNSNKESEFLAIFGDLRHEMAATNIEIKALVEHLDRATLKHQKTHFWSRKTGAR